MSIENNNNNDISLMSNKEFHRRKSEYRRYRSGSSSDSAINLESTLEDETNLMIKESSDILDDFNKMVYNFACLASQKQIPVNSIIFERVLSVTRKYYSIHESKDCFNKFGFISNKSNETTNEDKNISYFEYLISEILNSNSIKHWTDSCESIKCLIRDYGIPNTLRPQIWLIFIKSKITQNIDINQILTEVSNETLFNTDIENNVFRQIDLDIHRTFPNHKMFIKGADGISKLRNILIGYCVCVNPRVGYCQGMNFIGALLLIIFEGNEEYSLMGLIAIIDHYFPPHYYDHHLTGARADQMLLKDLILEMKSNFKIQSHLNDQMLEEITNALSLNWFLSLYHSSLPWQVRLYTIDCFLLEGVKVLFRFSLALIKMAIDKIDQDQAINSGDFINMIRETAKNCFDFFELKRIAFNEIKIPKRKYMATKRAFYVKQISIKSEIPMKTNLKESASQWIRRRSSELLGLKPNICEQRVVISSDSSKVVVFRKTNRNCSEISIFSSENKRKSEWNLKNALIFGISNDGNRIICSHSSSKTITKWRDGIKIDLIAVDFDPFDGFYFEELDSVIIISNSGLVFKYKINNKQNDTIIILNDKNYNIVCADLNRNCQIIWLNTVSNNNITHKFISFDTNSLDIYTIIESDFFNIEKFSTNTFNSRSVIVVKSDPINGKLKKTIDILTKDSQKERIFDFYDEIFDIKCFTIDEQINDLTQDCNHNLLNDVFKQKEEKYLIILVTKNSSNIYIEYKFNNFLRKNIVCFDQINDLSEINGIKIVRIIKESNECKATLLVYSFDIFLIDVKLALDI